MKSPKKFWISISAAVIISIITVSALVYFSPYPPRKPNTITAGDYSYAIDYSQYNVKKIMKTTKVPSIAVALIDDQEVIWQNVDGYANDEAKTPATLNTFYRVGSISKVFTAIEIMRLFDDGLLALDSPLTDYIPDFSINSRFDDNTSITIRSLLQHRSGLPRNGNLPTWYWDAQSNALSELTKSLKYSNVAYPVGYRYKYSNVGFEILGRIVELLRGDFFPTYVKTNLLRAIGMNDSTFLSQDIPQSGTLAVGHSREKRINVPVNQYDIIYMASGNLYSTIPDMAEFTKFIFRGGLGLEDQLIENTTLQMMFDPITTIEEDPKSIGLGWHIGLLNSKEKVVYHSGGIQGTHSLLAFLPERKLGIVLIGNSYEFGGTINQFGWEVLELMLEAKLGAELQEPPTKEVVSISLAQMELYVGTYIIEFELTD
ncbi:MAG: serine hydrolase domain-containing protein, partial [Candidatus Heimdallarchaeota archaeon]